MLLVSLIFSAPASAASRHVHKPPPRPVMTVFPVLAQTPEEVRKASGVARENLWRLRNYLSALEQFRRHHRGDRAVLAQVAAEATWADGEQAEYDRVLSRLSAPAPRVELARPRAPVSADADAKAAWGQAQELMAPRKTAVPKAAEPPPLGPVAVGR
ncbi:MAG TPA: hypothetical protein VNI01_10395 [Elusimicrobiota bacterium]|nr:hypothetical protein [Elusimicrobiota bacterium]